SKKSSWFPHFFTDATDFFLITKLVFNIQKGFLQAVKLLGPMSLSFAYRDMTLDHIIIKVDYSKIIQHRVLFEDKFSPLSIIFIHVGPEQLSRKYHIAVRQKPSWFFTSN